MSHSGSVLICLSYCKEVPPYVTPAIGRWAGCPEEVVCTRAHMAAGKSPEDAP